MGLQTTLVEDILFETYLSTTMKLNSKTDSIRIVPVEFGDSCYHHKALAVGDKGVRCINITMHWFQFWMLCMIVASRIA